MRQFVQRHADQILGVLSGFDRIRLRGSLRLFSTEGGVASWLQGAGVALKDFFKWAENLTDRLRGRTEQIARDAGRPVQYLNGFVNKESLVEKIRTERGVADNGLVADLRVALYGEPSDLKERKRQAGRVTRQLAMLRAHGLIKKIPRTHR